MKTDQGFVHDAVPFSHDMFRQTLHRREEIKCRRVRRTINPINKYGGTTAPSEVASSNFKVFRRVNPRKELTAPQRRPPAKKQSSTIFGNSQKMGSVRRYVDFNLG